MWLCYKRCEFLLGVREKESVRSYWGWLVTDVVRAYWEWSVTVGVRAYMEWRVTDGVRAYYGVAL